MSRLFADITLGRAIAFALWVALCIQAAYGQQLPIRHYDTHDGLAHTRISAIHQDTKGYLWIGTWEGLSRFDGYRFVNYDTGDGLGQIIINSITEDGRGRLWVATNGGGISRLVDEPAENRSLGPNELTQPGKRFESFLIGGSAESNRVNALVFDSQNNLWCGTDAGLYRAGSDQSGRLKFELIVPDKPVYAALADRQGRLWFGGEKELIEIAAGQVIKYYAADHVGYSFITSIVEDHRGNLFLADGRSVFQFVESEDSQTPARWTRFPLVFQPGQNPAWLYAGFDGALWVGTWTGGLIKYKEGQRLYTTAQGLSDDHIRALDEDGDGNLWVGTQLGGLCKLSGEISVSFTRAQGLPNQAIARVIEDRQGRIYASTESGLVKIEGGKAAVIPGSQAAPFNTVGPNILQDRHGDWWIGTKQGLFRFQGPELQLRRGKKFTAVDGLTEEAIAGVYEDPNGTIWIAVQGNLYYFDSAQRSRAVFRPLGLRAIYWPTGLTALMVGDRTGTLWVGGWGRLARLSGGVVRDFQPTNGLPETETRALFLDSRGWLWIGLRNQGVSMTKDPASESPGFVNYSTAGGLASNFVLSIAEDDAGRIYLGTFKGVDRLDPASGETRHFTTTDGLAGEIAAHCLRDHLGNIWVGTSTGLSRLNPYAERAVKRPPSIYLSRVQLAGEALPLAETGAVRAKAGDLPASRNNLLIEFIGLSFQSERALRYQYKLEGADAEWGALTEQRSVNYARLAPGSYRFLVRAINQQGITSLEPASFEFRILPPIWERWWFLSLAALMLAAAAYAIYRYRLRRVIELERVRTRIASDLHDDIGSNLSLIAGLSEVLGEEARSLDSRIAERLAVMADVSRRSVEAMSDIVWAVNPKRDNLLDLAHRMRRFGSDSLVPRNIDFHFDGPDRNQNVRVDAEMRREVFLVFKEGINNLARHSGCKAAEASVKIERGMIILKLKDDGCGFDPADADDGHGLENMRRRAEKLGGQLEVISEPGAGTRIIFRAPVSPR